MSSAGSTGMIVATEFQPHLRPCGNCGEETAQCCENCRKEFFCSDICQEERREQHKLICFPAQEEICEALRNRPGENKPNGVWVATRDINEGEEIFKDYPLLTGPGEEEPVPGRHVCLGCHKILDNFDEVIDERKCGDCGWPLCGNACPGIDRHLKECETLTRMRLNEPKTKFVDLVASGRAGVEKAYEIIRVVRILNLVKDTTRMHSFLNVCVRVHDQRYPEQAVNFFKSRGLVDHLSNDAILRIISTEYKYRRSPYYPRGDRAELLIYEKESRRDISCMGNCYISQIPISNEMEDSHGIAFVAAKPIQKGERLSITFGGNPKWNGTKRRRETHVKNNPGDIGFVCNCARCSDPTELGTNVSAIKCMECKSGLLLPLDPLDDKSKWKCNTPTCEHILLASDVDKIVRKAQWEADDLTAAQLLESFQRGFSTDIDLLDPVKDFVGKYEKILNPCHYILLNVREFTPSTWTVMIMNHNAVFPDYPDWPLSPAELSQKIDEHRRVVGMLLDIASKIFPPLSIPSLVAHFRVAMSNFFSAQQAVRNKAAVEVVLDWLKQGISHRRHIKEIKIKMSLTFLFDDNSGDQPLTTYLEEAYNNALELCILTPNYSEIPDMIMFVQNLSTAAVPTTEAPTIEEN